MPKAQHKTDTDKEEMATSHGAINEEEAEHHREMLQKAIADLKESAMGTEIKEIMGDFITATKSCCEKIYPPPYKCRGKEGTAFHRRPLWTGLKRAV